MLKIFSCVYWPPAFPLKKYLFASSAHFLIYFSFFDVKMKATYISWILILHRPYHLQIFSAIKYVVFSFFVSFPLICKGFCFTRSNSFIFAFLSFSSVMMDQQKCCCDLCQRVFSLCFSQEFYSVLSYI